MLRRRARRGSHPVLVRARVFSASERRLREAYAVFQLIMSAESPHTVRAWFIGLNPQLEDESPVEAIAANRFREVAAAARAFVSGD